MNNKERVFAACLAALAVVGVVGEASAVDTKVFSAIECQAIYGSDQDQMEYYGGSISNTDPVNTLTVRCPIVRDCGNDAGLNDLDVYVDDPASTQTCVAYARSPTGTSYYSEQQYTSGTGEQTIDFGTVFNNSITDWTMFFSCTMPPEQDRAGTSDDHGGRVWGYRVVETCA